MSTELQTHEPHFIEHDFQVYAIARCACGWQGRLHEAHKDRAGFMLNAQAEMKAHLEESQ